jgi:hypothetical protein
MWLECVGCEDGQEEWKEEEKGLERHIENRDLERKSVDGQL